MPNNFTVVGLCGRDWERQEEAVGEAPPERSGLDVAGDFLEENDFPEDVVRAIRKLASREVDRNLAALNGANLCQIVSPLPEELEGITASNPPCRWRHRTTGEWCKDANGPPHDSREGWERVALTDAEQADLRRKHGASNWYDWQSDTWGTKWGTYGLSVTELSGDGSPVLIEFQCAWCAPNPETMRKIEDYLREKHFLGPFKWIGFDPGSDEVVDIEVAPSTEDTVA